MGFPITHMPMGFAINYPQPKIQRPRGDNKSKRAAATTAPLEFPQGIIRQVIPIGIAWNFPVQYRSLEEFGGRDFGF